ncbi:MAG: hypothetical protein ACR2QF_05715 [Geminicoccaceae bacterium]
MLSEHIKIQERPDRDRTATIGASEIARCARQLAHARAGTRPDAEHELSGFAERGHWMERWWVAQLRQSPIGHKIKHAGAHQRTLNYGPLSATPDAIYDNAWCADCKSFDPRISILPKPEHVVQVRLTARIAQEQGLISHNGGGVLNYVNASDYGDIREFELPVYGDEEFQSLVKRAHDILSLEPNSHPREGWIAGGKECADCPFRTACLGEKIEEANDLTPDALSRVEDLCEQARTAKQQAEDLETAERKAKDEILQILRANRTRRVKGHAYIKRGVGKGSLDKEALEADGIDLSLYCSDGKVWESVVIQKPKQE